MNSSIHPVVEEKKLKDHSFSIDHTIHELKHYLPSQTPLKDFIHHNSLHAFQDKNFYEAIFTASEIFGFQVTLPLKDFRNLYKNGRIREEILIQSIEQRHGYDQVEEWVHKLLEKEYVEYVDPRAGRLRKYWRDTYKVDLDNLVQPLLFRILCSYLDQGIAIQHFPNEDAGLVRSIRMLEANSFTSFFKTRRAKELFQNEDTTIEQLLTLLVGDEKYFEQYVLDQQFSHRGWSGIVCAIEEKPESILYPKNIHLKDVIFLELIMEIDALDKYIGKDKWSPIGQFVKENPIDYFASSSKNEFTEILKIWQDSFEWTYYNEVMFGLREAKSIPTEVKNDKSFQAIFCIDEREDSLRRHIEATDSNCETLGCPGFFGVEFFFQPFNGKFYEKLCPAPVTPKFLIKEYGVDSHRKKEIFYSKRTHSLEAVFATLSLGILAAYRLLLNLFRPKMSPAIADAFAHMNVDGKLMIENEDPNHIENGLQVGFTISEMSSRVETLLKGIGMVKEFAPLVYVVGHGSSSANNPHHGAHDCGACSGRPGSVNARVFAFMANHKKVRHELSARGLTIPESTQFVGALHDTASDEIAFYDLEILSDTNKKLHDINVIKFEESLDLNAKERSRRFASINTKQDIKKVREAIRQRSVSMFEPRPELGHGTNALCFIGKRQLTKNLFFDRRAFMNSYDHEIDPEGNFLLGVIRPIPPVCGGINLEYYFSRVDNYKLGAGTKLPHNVMGLVGVSNSSDGDLRPGLPLQMIEVHDPVRLLILVEHKPDVILNTIQKDPALYDWFVKKWVHLVAINPDDDKFYYFRNHSFVPYEPVPYSIGTIHDVHSLMESAKEMETNHIVHATRENLPVHIIK